MTLLYFTGFDATGWSTDATSDGWQSIGPLFTVSPGQYGFGQAISTYGTSVATYPLSYSNSSSNLIFGFAIVKLNTEGFYIGFGNSVPTSYTNISGAWITFGSSLTQSTVSNGTYSSNNSTTVNFPVSTTYTYVEFSLSLTTGSIQINVNGVSTGSLTLTTPITPTCFFICNANGTYGSAYVDNLYILSNDGSYPSSYLGRIQCSNAVPSSIGNTATFTSNTGSTTYSNLVDSPSDGDTTYNITNTPVAEDTFNISGLSSSQIINTCTPLAIRVSNTSRNSHGTYSSITNILHTSTDGLGQDKNLSTNYSTNSDIFTNDPATGLAFGSGVISTLQIGYKRES